jgi:hypothetical protein
MQTRQFGKRRCKLTDIYTILNEQEDTGFWRGKLGEIHHLEDPSVDGRIIFRWVFRKLVGEHELDWSDSV